MKNKFSVNFIFGIILILIGLFMLFKSVYVRSFDFIRIGGLSTGSILIVLLIISIVAAIIKPNKITMALAPIVLIMLAITVLLSIRLSFRGISVLDVMLMIIPLAVGLGLVFKSMFKKE